MRPPPASGENTSTSVPSRSSGRHSKLRQVLHDLPACAESENPAMNPAVEGPELCPLLRAPMRTTGLPVDGRMFVAGFRLHPVERIGASR